MGSGTTTIFPQIAADALGIPMERVGIRWRDTALPSANNAKAQLAALANVAPGPDAGGAMRRAGVEEIVAEGRFALPGAAMFEARAARVRTPCAPSAPSSWR